MSSLEFDDVKVGQLRQLIGGRRLFLEKNMPFDRHGAWRYAKHDEFFIILFEHQTFNETSWFTIFTYDGIRYAKKSDVCASSSLVERW